MFADFNIINTFLTVIKTRSFSKTSQILKISQPAVTLQMKKLEDAVGVMLLLRKKNGILLTKEGEKFKELCDRLENHIQIFNEDIATLKEGRSKMIIATTCALQETLLPLYLDDISKKLDKEIDIRVKEEGELSKYIEDGRCDVAFGLKVCFGKNVITKECFRYNFILVSNKKTRTKITATELASLKFIKDSTKSFDFIFENLAIGYKDLNSLYTVNGTMAVLNILYHSDNEYYAFMPEYMMHKCINDGIVHKVDLVDGNLERIIYAGCLKENEALLDQILSIRLK